MRWFKIRVIFSSRMSFIGLDNHGYDGYDSKEKEAISRKGKYWTPIETSDISFILLMKFTLIYDHLHLCFIALSKERPLYRNAWSWNFNQKRWGGGGRNKKHNNPGTFFHMKLCFTTLSRYHQVLTLGLVLVAVSMNDNHIIIVQENILCHILWDKNLSNGAVYHCKLNTKYARFP